MGALHGSMRTQTARYSLPDLARDLFTKNLDIGTIHIGKHAGKRKPCQAYFSAGRSQSLPNNTSVANRT